MWQFESKERLAKVRVFPHGAHHLQPECGIFCGAGMIFGADCVRMAGFCEHGNEPRGCVKIRDFLTVCVCVCVCVCACQLFKIYFPAVNWQCLIRSSCPQFLVLSKDMRRWNCPCPQHDGKCWRRGTAPLILNIGTGWR